MTNSLKSSFYILSITGLLCFCNPPVEQKESSKEDTVVTSITGVVKFQYLTLTGDSVFNSANPPESALVKYDSAKAKYLNNKDSADLIIWYGRRAGYLGRYNEAINIFSEGISKHPEDPRMYRHRGHRYLTTRKFDLAVNDFEKAAQLIEGTEDQIEPDGIPNKLNTPTSTLHSNIWYHLGLAYYLKNDLNNALKAYEACAAVSRNDDMIVSTAHWHYMTLRRMGNSTKAGKVVQNITTDMNIIENQSYQQLGLFYKGLLTEEDLQNTESGNPSNDAVLYGLGNWFLYNGETEKVKAYFEKILKNGNKASFGYIAAEADYVREFRK